MRIVIHVSGYFDWRKAPPGLKVTEADIKSNQVREAADGSYQVRVPITGKTHTTVMLPENQLIQTIIRAYCEDARCGEILTRQQAVARHLASMVVPHHTHRKWMTDIEVEDDGPSEELFRAMIAPHLDADHGKAPGKNIEPEDVDELVEAYMSCPNVDAEHVVRAEEDHEKREALKVQHFGTDVHLEQRKARNDAHVDHLKKHFKIGKVK